MKSHYDEPLMLTGLAFCSVMNFNGYEYKRSAQRLMFPLDENASGAEDDAENGSTKSSS